MSFGKTNYRSGGTRGGADQFKWEDVKNDKYRENYLGHSLQAPVGRWQKGKDLTWYAKTSKEQRALELKQEILLAKQRDEDLMNEALGLAPHRRHEPTGQLDASEMKELLKRGESERDGMDAERVEGLGAAPVIAGVETGPKKTLAERYKETLESGKQDTTFALPGTIDAPNVNGDAAQEKESKEERKARKAAKKQQRKEEKKAKKERKKERKEKKHSGASLSHRSGRKYSSDDDVRRGTADKRNGRSRSRSRGCRTEGSRSASRSPSRGRSSRQRSRSRSRDRGRDRACDARGSTRRTPRSHSRSPSPRAAHASSTSRRRDRSRSYSPESRHDRRNERRRSRSRSRSARRH